MIDGSIRPGLLLLHTYRVERFLTRGGMGEVYLARHVELDTLHAIKVIKPELFHNETVLALSRREASVLRGIRNEVVVGYDGFFRDEKGRHYLVMEYVEGPSLGQLLEQRALSTDEVYLLRDRIALGLGAVHERGVVHRDLSPDNVILADGRIERAKLIDFGIAKLTAPAVETIIGAGFAGKLRYASPEQLGLFGGRVDARSDIYSLGLVLIAAATGRAPEIGESFEAVRQARQSVPNLHDVPDVLKSQLTAMLQPDPKDRPGSLAELIRGWPLPGPVPVDSAPTRVVGPSAPQHEWTEESAEIGRERKFFRPSVIVAAIVVCALIGVGGYLLKEHFGKKDEADEKIPTQVLTIQQIAELPWRELYPYVQDFVARGNIDNAFAVLREAIRKGHELPLETTYEFSQDLLLHGRTDEAFALLRELAGKGHGPSALAIGEMYDPVLWNPEQSPFTKANPRQAEKWYRQALAQGSQEARTRLESLERWRRRQEGSSNDQP
jgi:serine/threonine-protein kinase